MNPFEVWSAVVEVRERMLGRVFVVLGGDREAMGLPGVPAPPAKPEEMWASGL